jgi:hypothetical protein
MKGSAGELPVHRKANFTLAQRVPLSDFAA